MASLSTTALTGVFSRLEEYPRLFSALKEGKTPLALSGLAAVHRAHLAAALHKDTGRPLVLVCADDAEARRMAGDLAAFTG